MLTESQVKERINYIGGGDAAAILGLSRYRTALEVWSIKTGQIRPEDISQEMPVKLGNMLEETVCKLFEEETGKVLLPTTETLFHPKYKFIGGNLDRLVKGERALFEAKTTNSFKQSEWENEGEIPVEYQIQCHHYLAVTGLDRAYIGCLIGNRKFLWRIIERDEKLLANIVAKEVAFWNNFIVPKIMPMQITSEDGGVLYRLFPQAAPESVIELGDEAQKICEIRDSSLADLKALEKQIEEYDNTLKAMLKTYESGSTKTYRISWKNQRERRLDTALLKKEEPAIYERYSPEKEKRVLRIAVKK
jgi:putative phage-type endonuclease